MNHNNIIIGTGSCIPGDKGYEHMGTVITNENLKNYVDLSTFNEEKARCTYPIWIEKVMGFKKRYKANYDVASSDIAVEAAKNAIADAGISASDIDLILLSTATPDMFSPHTAAIVQDKLGISGNYACDRLSACPGFIWGLLDTDALMKSHGYKYVLNLSGDKMSRIVHPKDMITMPTFSDGFGATITRRFDNELNLFGIKAGFCRTDGKRGGNLEIPYGGSKNPINLENIAEVYAHGLYALQMNAQGVKSFAIDKLIEATRYVLNIEQIPISKVDYFIPHQASEQFVFAGASELGIPLDRVLINLDKYANMSQASIPVLLDEHSKKKTFKNGDLIVMTGMGGGLGWGSLVYSWFDFAQVPKNILIVDEKIDIAIEFVNVLGETFKQDESFISEIHFYFANGGEEAIKMLEQRPGFYDIMIVDHRMITLSGVDTIEKAKKIDYSFIGIILISELDENDMNRIMNSKTVDQIMLKPFFKPNIDLKKFKTEDNYLSLKKIIEKPYLVSNRKPRF